MITLTAMHDHDYVDNYLKAIDRPLPELQETFNAELAFFRRIIQPNFTVLDVGCGSGRMSRAMAPYVEKVVGVENSPRMLDVARKRCALVQNLELKDMDALKMEFADHTFDLVFDTYNLIGSLDRPERDPLVNEMARVTKKGGKMVNITWKDDAATTRFLKKYYPSIGIEIQHINALRTVTSKGTFERLSKMELEVYYEKAGVFQFAFEEIGPVWLAIVGTK